MVRAPNEVAALFFGEIFGEVGLGQTTQAMTAAPANFPGHRPFGVGAANGSALGSHITCSAKSGISFAPHPSAWRGRRVLAQTTRRKVLA